MTNFNSHVRRMSSDRLLYSLGHLHEHLLKAKQYARLFSLARRGEFLTEQSRTFHRMDANEVNITCGKLKRYL